MVDKMVPKFYKQQQKFYKTFQADRIWSVFKLSDCPDFKCYLPVDLETLQANSMLRSWGLLYCLPLIGLTSLVDMLGSWGFLYCFALTLLTGLAHILRSWGFLYCLTFTGLTGLVHMLRSWGFLFCLTLTGLTGLVDMSQRCCLAGISD